MNDWARIVGEYLTTDDQERASELAPVLADLFLDEGDEETAQIIRATGVVIFLVTDEMLESLYYAGETPESALKKLRLTFRSKLEARTYLMGYSAANVDRGFVWFHSEELALNHIRQAWARMVETEGPFHAVEDDEDDDWRDRDWDIQDGDDDGVIEIPMPEPKGPTSE